MPNWSSSHTFPIEKMPFLHRKKNPLALCKEAQPFPRSNTASQQLVPRARISTKPLTFPAKSLVCQLRGYLERRTSCYFINMAHSSSFASVQIPAELVTWNSCFSATLMMALMHQARSKAAFNVPA